MRPTLRRLSPVTGTITNEPVTQPGAAVVGTTAMPWPSIASDVEQPATVDFGRRSQRHAGAARLLL